MKDFILTALLAISLTFQSHFVISQTHFPDSIFNQGTCNSYNLTLSQRGEENTLYPYFYGKERKDRIKIHPFSIIEIGGWQAFTASLVQEEEITFEHISTSKSRFLKGQYYRYQQLYQGVPVLGGGFNILIEPGGTSEIPGPPCEGCPPPSPCALVSYISAHIFENIDIDVTNTNLLAESQLNTILSIDASQLRSRKLSIAHDMAGECTYKLVWKVDYQDSQKGDRIGWIDNETGVLLSETSKHNFHNAPTADYGIQFLDDQVEGDEKILKNNRLTAYDLSPSFGDPGITKIENTSILFGGNKIPIASKDGDWEVGDASEEVFQAFWMASIAIELLDVKLSLILDNVQLGVHPFASGAAHFIDSSVPEGHSRLAFGILNGVSTVEFDIVAHELTHALLRRNFGIRSDILSSSSIHEGLSDIFGTYLEANFEGLDWVIGDNDPALASEIDRDLQNTAYNCFTDVQGLDESNNSARYIRSQPLSHWFYLCVNGNASAGIESMNMDELMQIIVEALAAVEVSNPDYTHIMNRTIEIAENVYGTCSSQLQTIVSAWEQICVETNHLLADPDVNCASLLASVSNNAACEENNNFGVCLSDGTGLNYDLGSWNIVGRNSVYFESTAGMQGNAQQGGKCLNITHVPNMPYYPQEITVYYWHPDIGERISKRITIMDCDNDDPTCEDYYNLQGLIEKDDGSASSSYDGQFAHEPRDVHAQSDPNADLKVIAFDIMGNKLHFVQEKEWDTSNAPTIIILTYWSKDGYLVKSEKVFVSHSR